MYSLTRRLDDLRIEQFAYRRTLKKQKQAANFNDIEQLKKLQNRVREEIEEIGHSVKGISKICFDHSAEFTEKGIIIKFKEDSEVDPAIEAVKCQCAFLMRDFQICAKKYLRDDDIIDDIRTHMNELGAKSPNVEIMTREERQDQEQDESFGLDQLYREK
jgi:hypothetical protein